MKRRWIYATCFSLAAIAMAASQLAAVAQAEQSEGKSEEQAFSLKVTGMT